MFGLPCRCQFVFTVSKLQNILRYLKH